MMTKCKVVFWTGSWERKETVWKKKGNLNKVYIV